MNEQHSQQSLILLIGELKGEMKNLVAEMSAMRTSFDNLEKGRLSRLEIQFANLIGKLTVISVAVSGLISFGSILVQKYISFR